MRWVVGDSLGSWSRSLVGMVEDAVTDGAWAQRRALVGLEEDQAVV